MLQLRDLCVIFKDTSQKIVFYIHIGGYMDRQQSLFPVINLSRTGRNIEQCRRQAGLTVKDVQNYFGFEYPQAIYKWQHGECLPTVDNLLALAHLLDVPMENLLAYDDREVVFFCFESLLSPEWARP